MWPMQPQVVSHSVSSEQAMYTPNRELLTYVVHAQRLTMTDGSCLRQNVIQKPNNKIHVTLDRFILNDLGGPTVYNLGVRG